jgi:3-hydroxyacyl-CoA dehydrogenase/3a,7a,12a-trihydroxy-5b-cholest-24-enoyl-CoA hydratase
VSLYALSVGASTSAGEDGLKYIYEGHPDFSVLPSFAVLPALQACFQQVQEGLPGIDIDLTRVCLKQCLVTVRTSNALDGQINR